MGTVVTLNSTSYTIPANGESGWGTQVTNYLVALGSGVLQKAGGAFTLTAEVDFGTTHGLKSAYFKSRATNPAAAGQVRLGNTETVAWRNAANSADLGLSVNSSNVLQFNGSPVVALALGAANTALRMNSGGTAYEWAALTNANIDAAAAIAYSKLNLATSIVNADISGSAAIAYSKLALSGAIVNADISASAAIAYSKLALSGSIATGDLASGLLVPIGKGGTGQTSANAALNAFLPTQTSNANKVLTTDGTNTSWTAVSTTVTTTRGDLISRGTSADQRLAIGTAGQILTTDGTDPTWSSTISALTGFTGGKWSAENIRASEGSGTTTLTSADKRTQVFNLSNGRTCVLPTTGIKAGEIWKLVNLSTTNDLAVQSSAGTAMTIANSANMDATIRRGYVQLVALQDAPTTPSHWQVTDLNEYYAFGVLTTQNSGALTSNSVTATGAKITRTNKQATFFWNGTTNATSNAAASTFSFASATIPTRFQPEDDADNVIPVRDNGATKNTPGKLQFNQNGSILVYANVDGASLFTNATSIGAPARGHFSWVTK